MAGLRTHKLLIDGYASFDSPRILGVEIQGTILKRIYTSLKEPPTNAHARSLCARTGNNDGPG
jgi:hypothetical protein